MSWDLTKAVEIELTQEDDFLKIRETLSRIGIGSWKSKTLYQSCHILHKQSKYYIIHFKGMFALDGRKVEFDENDWKRQNRIAKILSDWGMCKTLNTINEEDMCTPSEVRVIKHSDKKDWTLEKKYAL